MMWYINYFHTQILVIELLCIWRFPLRFPADSSIRTSCWAGLPLGFWPCVCCPGCCSGSASA